ncbi:hypothetical protein ABMY23_22470 [Vibrio vulnificus]|uniref:hypothetical protein n=1 Tax=Vibrio vulnificus TaxID=672 RepID=UPI003ED8FDB9
MAKQTSDALALLERELSSSIGELEQAVKSKQANTRSAAKNEEAESKLLDRLKQHNDIKTRGNLTTLFLVGLFLLLLLSGAFVLWYNHLSVQWALTLKYSGIETEGIIKPLELESVLSLIINSFGTSLGFIIGYYFKDKIS